jgi:histidinol dehydrogenase
MMNIIKYPEKQKWEQLFQRPQLDNSELVDNVSAIMKDVKENGDAALFKYTRIFDKVSLDATLIDERELTSAHEIEEELKTAIDQAINNISKFHKNQLSTIDMIETMPGINCWRKSVPIEKIGLYIPGGTAPLFSTLIMLAIPAKIAGCREIVICTPPEKTGKIHPALLYVASQLGINAIYKIGGAQAIAAMAYGTETMPRVYKIFGPGNQYVTTAKQLVQLEGTAIDMPAGPSELCVLADDSANPVFVAADLLSQAEHGHDSQVLLITDSEVLAIKVNEQLKAQLLTLKRKEMTNSVLQNSKIIIVNNMSEGIEMVNEYAPEHLIINCKNEQSVTDMVTNAGSVFIGNYSAESAGDYASGTNHVLPTNGFAKAYSGVSVESFVKKISFQKLSKVGLQNISSTIIAMAMAEGLDAHANAIKVRL